MGIITYTSNGPISSGSQSNALGSISIDISSVRQSATEMVALSKTMAKSLTLVDSNLSGLSRGFDKTSSSVASLDKESKNYLGTLKSLSILAPAGAMKISNNYARLEFMMKRLVGNEKDASKEMAILKQFSQETNQSYEDILHSATAMLPLLKGQNVELKDAVSLAVRLGELDPMQGTQGAGIALKEFLSGEYLSLVRRFELDRTKLKEITKKSQGNPAEKIRLLNEYMASIGYGSDMLTEMDKAGVGTMQSVLDAMKQLIDKGFRPLRDDYILPVLRGIRSIARELEKLPTDVLAGIIGTASILGAGVGLSNLPLIGGALAPVAAPLIGGAAGAYAGVQMGTMGVRYAADKGATIGGIERFKGKNQEEAQAILFEDFKTALKTLAIVILEGAKQIIIGMAKLVNFIITLPDTFDKLTDVIKDSLVNMFDNLKLSVVTFVRDFFGIMDSMFKSLEDIKFDKFGVKFEPFKDIGGSLDGIMTTLDEKVSNLTDSANESGVALDNSTQALKDTVKANIELTDGQKEVVQGITDLQISIADVKKDTNLFRDSVEKLRETFKKTTPLIGPQTSATNFDDAQIEAFDKMQDSIAKLESDTDEKRIKENKEFQSDIAKIDKDYHDETVKDLRDFNLEQKRENEDYNKKRNDIIAESDDKSTSQTLEHNKKITEIEDEARGNELEAAEKYLKTLDELTKQYQLDLGEAANNLDVSKVISLTSKYNLEKDKLATSYQDEIDQIRETRIKRIEEERLTLQSIIEENRKSKEQRLQDLKDENDLRKQRDKEDFDLEQADKAVQHQQDLDARKAEYEQTLIELKSNLALQKDEIVSQFKSAFDKIAEEAGQHQDMMFNINKNGQNAIEQQLLAFWNKQKAAAALLNGLNRPLTNTTQSRPSASIFPSSRPVQNGAGSKALGISFPTFATGGMMLKSGFAKLERGEHVLRPDAASAFRSIVGSEITPNNINSAFNDKRNPVIIQNTNSFGDIGSYSRPDIEGMFEQIANKTIEKFFAVQTQKI